VRLPKKEREVPLRVRIVFFLWRRKGVEKGKGPTLSLCREGKPLKKEDRIVLSSSVRVKKRKRGRERES